MHRLAVRLPPFSPDYSGVCSALFELGGMIVIHDASGCTGNYTGYDEPRWYGSDSLVFCSALRELDAVLGNDDKFIRKIQTAAADLKPRFICFLGSPVPMVIGSDFTGIAREIEEATNIPAFGFVTSGLFYYDKGVSDAFLAFSRRFVSGQRGKLPKSINLLGATPLDFAASGNIGDFVREFERLGFRVLSSFAMGSSFEALVESPHAAVNIVLSHSGLELARHFRKTFGTPYVVGQPMGTVFADKLCEMVEQSAGDGQNRWYRSPHSGRDKRALIVAEQVTAHSLRGLLETEFDCACAGTATLFGLDPEIAADGDRALTSEKAVREAFSQGEYNIVVGDPLLRQLLPEDSDTRFIPLPHVAVSSKIHWDHPPALAGEAIKDMIKKEVFA